jgi:hypothetical protein
MEWFGTHGYAVYLPVGHSPDSDLIAEHEGSLFRVRVKTTRRYFNRRWNVMLCTRGGNQSWNGLVKRFSPTRCDCLFVLVADGRRWFIPADAIAASTCVLLGGPKYAQFEVESGASFSPEHA